MNRGDELDRDISLALAKRVESDEPSFATARRLQREGKKLRKRYLGPVRNAGEIAKRAAVDWANGAGGVYDPNRPSIKIPGIGAVIDFTVTDERPPLTIDWPSKSPLEQQLHPAGILRAKGLPEYVLRRWVEKWWIE